MSAVPQAAASGDAAGGLVHGMDAGLAAPDWPPLTLTELQALASQMPVLRAPLRLLWHSPRPFSAAARVQTAAGEVFVKRHDSRVRDVAALLEEHRFVEHLRARGVPVPRRHADIHGCTVCALQSYTYEVHDAAPGVDAYCDDPSWMPVRSPAQARALGQALARLHLAAHDYQAPPRPPRPLLAGIDIIGASDFSRALTDFVARRPALDEFLRSAAGIADIVAVLAPLHEQLRPLLPALAPSWVHNDWHASNLFWTDAGPQGEASAVLDFGLCNLGWAVADLATALERNTIAWLDLPRENLRAGTGIGRSDLALALLAGYGAVRPLAAAERAALPLLLGLAHVEYALSEADYFHGIVGNEHNARLACPQFLLGHVFWLQGPHGLAYLRALVQALDA